MPRKKKEATESQIDTHVFDALKEKHLVGDLCNDITVKEALNPGEMIGFVAQVVDMVFTNGYTPALFDYAVKYMTLSYYSNIALPQRDGLSDDLCEVLYCSDVLKYIYDGICTEQLTALIEAARLQIENRNRIIASYSNAEEMYSSFTSILDKVNDWLDNNLPALNVDAGALDSIRSIADKFANVPDEDVAKEVVAAMKDNNVVELPKA
jgi:hypothetical protein